MKWLKWIAPVLVLAGAAALSAVLNANKPEASKETVTARPTSVYTASAKPTESALVVNAQGEVRARTQIDLVAQVSGRVVAVSEEFIEGGNVTPNATLLRIDDTDYRLALSRAKAQVAGAEVSVQEALADANVARKQLRNIESASALALKKPQVAQARARLEAARAEVQQATLNLARTKVSLPFAGKFISTNANVGQYVSLGTPLARVFATEVVDVRLALSDSQLAALGLPIGYKAPENGGPAIKFSATVAGQLQTWQGQLVRVDAAIDPSSRMLFATAQVRSPYDKNRSDHSMPLAVGLYVNAEITGKTTEGAVTIPAAALRAGDQVYVIKDGKLAIKPVKVLHKSATEAVLEAGIAPDAEVVISPVRNPINGMDIISLNKPTQPLAAE
ncbi:MAG: efflux transporter periplasmic adaptor subunit [Gammaproteobacteria bacterium]|nr:MAG: efflux transporter periplasmic adaptor subunit [Gammaproteobacteria bacterium]